jgi:hypothetical protein
LPESRARSAGLTAGSNNGEPYQQASCRARQARRYTQVGDTAFPAESRFVIGAGCDFGWHVAADYRRYVAVLVCSRFSAR